MFAFVCPIRHPETSNNYQEVVNQLRLTIESVCAQKTNEKFVFVVVCNRIPQINLPEAYRDNVVFVAVDFPPPEKRKGTAVSLDGVKYDKGTKTAAGLLYLKKYQPDYVFVIDGDDWINVNTIETVKNSEVDLWYANSGFIVNYQNKTHIKKYGVCRYCGSTFIYKYDTLMELSGLNQLTETEYTQQALASLLDTHILKNILGNHRHQLPFYKQQGYTTKPLPIPAVSWILNTGENHTGKDGGQYGIPISNQFAENFGVKSISLPRRRARFSNLLRAKYDSIQSWIGWRFTDKNADKI